MTHIYWHDVDDPELVYEATGVTANEALPPTRLSVWFNEFGKYDWYLISDLDRNGKTFEAYSTAHHSIGEWDTPEEAKAACEAFYLAAS